MGLGGVDAISLEASFSRGSLGPIAMNKVMGLACLRW